MKCFKRLENLKDTANKNDQLVEGFFVTIDNEVFRIFVMDELTGSQRGYILKLMYHDGKDEQIDLHDETQFPQVTNLFMKYCCGLWKNQGTKRHCYKYIVFGHGRHNRVIAVTIMRQIVCDILISSSIK